MAQAETGNIVKVHYKGLLDNDEIFDSSFEDDPIEFEIGKGNLLAGFEQAVIDLEEGEMTTVSLEAEAAYGPYQEEYVMSVPNDQMPKDITPQKGLTLQGHTEDGKTHLYTIIDIKDNLVVVDGNHPLAGKDLTFEIKLLEIVK